MVGRHIPWPLLEAIPELHKQGLYDHQIAERLRISTHTVWRHRTQLRLPPNGPPLRFFTKLKTNLVGAEPLVREYLAQIDEIEPAPSRRRWHPRIIGLHQELLKSRPVTDATPADFEAVAHALLQRGTSRPNTRAYLNALLTFHQWLDHRDPSGSSIARHAASNLRWIRRLAGMTLYQLTFREVGVLFLAVRDLLDYTVLLLLATTGMTLGQISRARICDVTWNQPDSPTLAVRSRNGALSHHVALTADAFLALQTLQQYRRTPVRPESKESLILNRRGRPLGYANAKFMFAQLARFAELDTRRAPVTYMSVRDWFARELHHRGVPNLYAQAYIGLKHARNRLPHMTDASIVEEVRPCLWTIDELLAPWGGSQSLGFARVGRTLNLISGPPTRDYS